jgi:hypothetical protein
MPQVMPRPLSNQQAFDNVWQHFIVDRNPRAVQGGMCCYRTTDGRMCAVGCQLPDALYLPDMEATAASTAVGENSAVAEYFRHVTPTLLNALQHAHDAPRPRAAEDEYAAMARKLRDVATEYGLTVPSETTHREG